MAFLQTRMMLQVGMRLENALRMMTLTLMEMRDQKTLKETIQEEHSPQLLTQAGMKESAEESEEEGVQRHVDTTSPYTTILNHHNSITSRQGGMASDHKYQELLNTLWTWIGICFWRECDQVKMEAMNVQKKCNVLFSPSIEWRENLSPSRERERGRFVLPQSDGEGERHSLQVSDDTQQEIIFTLSLS